MPIILGIRILFPQTLKQDISILKKNNFNRPGLSTDLVNAPQNAFRYNDRGHNQFNLNQAAVGLKKNRCSSSI
jgi:hypothetical protein